jgi:hypothetical protein
MSKHLNDVLKTKAEVSDLITLRETKTNKIDTDQCLRTVEMLYRMLENIAVLQVEM